MILRILREAGLPRLLATAFIAAVAATPAWSANSASGTTVITMAQGNSVAITITPTTETMTQDVVAPGADWAYQSSAQTWFPAGVTDGWVYTPAGTAGCTKAAVTTFKGSWGLTAYYTLAPAASPVAVYLAPVGTSCTVPTSAAIALSTNSASPTTLQSGLNKSQTEYYYLLVTSTTGNPIGATTTITITYTAQ